MDLKGKKLDQWFKRQKPAAFGGLKQDYVKRYETLEKYLIQDVHPHVATGAAIKDGLFLNDHGPDHIATVIEKPSQLISSPSCTITAYECYLLLCAIHIHDIGNIQGRGSHEQRPRDMEGQLSSLLGEDSPEKRLIFRIAEAHGGSKNGNGDTIWGITDDPVLGQKVKARFLAALLRFSDELADDSRRTSRFVQHQAPIPKDGMVFHKYSSSLHSVVIDTTGSVIDLHFSLTRDEVAQPYERRGQTVYLIDEILARTLKMHKERVYCMKFMRPLVQIDGIKVTIKVFESHNSPDELQSIGYRLEDRGYPDEPRDGIYGLCPNLQTCCGGRPLTGLHLREHLLGGAE